MNEIERSVARYLDSVHVASRKLVEQPFDRIEVRRILIKLIQQSTALLTELDEDELQQADALQRNLETEQARLVFEQRRREAALQQEARRRLEKSARVRIAAERYNPALVILGLVLFHVAFFILIGVVIYITNGVWYAVTPR